MASPVVTLATATSISTAATSINVNTGTPAAGDLAIVCGRFAGAPGTVTFTGYTIMPNSPDVADASDDSTWVWYRVCNGAEGTTDALSTVNSVKSAFVYHRITGAEAPGTQPPQDTVATIGTGANLTLPVITPTGGPKDFLYIAFSGLDGETQGFGAPSGFTLTALADSGTGGAVATNCRIACAKAETTNTSSAGGGTFGNSAPNAGVTGFVIAIHPPASTSVDPAGFEHQAAIYDPALAQAVMRNRGR